MPVRKIALPEDTIPQWMIEKVISDLDKKRAASVVVPEFPPGHYLCVAPDGESWGVSRIAMPDYIEAQRELNRIYRSLL